MNYKQYGFNKISESGKISGEIFFFEKYDGSQLSFLIEEKNVVILNKGNIQKSDNRLYNDAYEYFVNIFLPIIIEKYGNNYIFHGESLIMNFRSNTLTYKSVPIGSFICFGIQNKSNKTWQHPLDAIKITKSIGMAFAHLIWSSTQSSNCVLNFNPKHSNVIYPEQPHDLVKMLTSGNEGELISSLGNMAEGIVVQCYHNDKLKFKKYPTPRFSEFNKQKKSKINEQISIKMLVEYIGLTFCSTARYQKGYQKYLVKLFDSHIDLQINEAPTINETILSNLIWLDIKEEKIDFIQQILFKNLSKIYLDKTSDIDDLQLINNILVKILPTIINLNTDHDLNVDYDISSIKKIISEHNLFNNTTILKNAFFEAFEMEIRILALKDLPEWLSMRINEK